jgi:hypothetical protein
MIGNRAVEWFGDDRGGHGVVTYASEAFWVYDKEIVGLL